MKLQSVCVLFILFLLSLLMDAFQDDNPYFRINKKDVELHIPKKFPKPVYDFRKNKISPQIFVLGRALFYDPILSKDSSTSCSFCHQRIAAFAHIDHPLSHGINGLIGRRNVPALQNLIWKDAFMLDGGVNHLEVQPLTPITNEREMNEEISHVILKLQRSPMYAAMFRNAFDDTLINSERMLKALAQFTGLMISSDSRYDKYIRNEDTMSRSEKNGLKLFRIHCIDCHAEPLFTDNSYRNIGLKPDTALKDSGRVQITENFSDYMKFKVPSLRNIEMTYPYMHDGRFRTLEQVMDYYSKGIFFSDQTDPAVLRNAGLSEAEKSELIAFLKTLTDQKFLHDRRFIDPFYHN